MNLYSNKQRWKLILFGLAMLIVATSLYYSSYIVEQVRKEEREKVGVWSVAVKKKANLVFLTTQLFDRLNEENALKAQYWAEAISFMSNTADNPDLAIDYGLPFSIISSNKSIPVILTDSENKYHSTTNLPREEDSVINRMHMSVVMAPNDAERLLREEELSDFLSPILDRLDSVNEPLVINDGYGSFYRLHYDKSSMFRILQHKHDSLIASFTEELVDNSLSVPVLFVNEDKDSVIATNIKGVDAGIMNEEAIKRMQNMGENNAPFSVMLGQNSRGFVYYEDSDVLTQLKYFPYIQFGIIGLFLAVSYLLFSTFRKAEQNQVWVGMAKETAHQLGTPLSSLMAWVDLLEAKGVDQETLMELNKDVERLEIITDRFSKIGSETELTPQKVLTPIGEITDYLRKRVSKRLTLEVIPKDNPTVPLNKPLFEWVVENLCKNAIDAMKGEGSITITITEEKGQAIIDLTDTGSGIPTSKFKTVFQPGYTTKKRGWGLGLSLVKRIIEEYHNGKIFVKSSEIGVGTTFRIILKLA